VNKNSKYQECESDIMKDIDVFIDTNLTHIRARTRETVGSLFCKGYWVMYIHWCCMCTVLSL